ncbi:MAG TPA: hypothetical protein VHL13_00370 [Pseudolabrys sp.]|nr:hypothetical protein [Pseudolabrys sp.]
MEARGAQREGKRHRGLPGDGRDDEACRARRGLNGKVFLREGADRDESEDLKKIAGIPKDLQDGQRPAAPEYDKGQDLPPNRHFQNQSRQKSGAGEQDRPFEHWGVRQDG